MKFLFISSFVVLFSLSAFANLGTISVSTKDVWLTKKGEEESKARRGLKIDVGDKIRTGKESYAKILMNDKNVIHIASESEMLIKEYEQKEGETTSSTLSVLYGKVRTSLEKKYDGKENRFRVETEAAIMGVRGTDFLTEHTITNQTSKTLVFESRVGASGIDTAGNPLGDVLISTGEMSTIVKGSPPTPPVKIPLDLLNQLNAASIAPGPFSLVAAAGAIPGLPLGLGDSGEEKKEEEPKKEEPKPVEEKPAEEKKEEAPKEAKPEEKPAEKKEESAESKSSDEDKWAVSLKAGTLGAGIGVSYKLLDNLRLKLDVYDTLDFTVRGEDTGEYYDATIDFSGVGLLGEWGSGIVHLVFGVYATNNRILADGAPLGNEAIGNTDYNFVQGDRVTGDGEFDTKLAPYVGLGLRFNILGLFRLVADVGAMQIGTLEVKNLEYTGATAISAEDVALEIQEIEDSVKDFKVFPVVRLGVEFRF